MVIFRNGIVGYHPANRRIPTRKNKIKQLKIDPVDLLIIEETEEECAIEIIEIIPEEPEEEKPKKLKDMTLEEKKEFYRIRAAKAKATRLRNKSTVTS